MAPSIAPTLPPSRAEFVLTQSDCKSEIEMAITLAEPAINKSESSLIARNFPAMTLPWLFSTRIR
jgi:hypothetical protein